MYLAEDYAFVERARRVGYKVPNLKPNPIIPSQVTRIMQVYIDSRVRNYHIGKYQYSWEDTATHTTLPKFP